jgi:hypothetical protein
MKKTHYSEDKMRSVYASWQQSGLSKKVFCHQRGIAYSTFFYWAKKFSTTENTFKPGFMELDPGKDFQSIPPAVELEIEYPSGAILRLYKCTDAAWIKSLL